MGSKFDRWIFQSLSFPMLVMLITGLIGIVTWFAQHNEVSIGMFLFSTFYFGRLVERWLNIDKLIIDKSH